MSLIKRVVLGVVLLAGLVPQASAQVVINEVLLRRSGSDPHRDQIVELRNAGSAAVAVGGWVFLHRGDRTSVIPGGVTIPAGGLLVAHFRASGDNSATEVYFPNDVLAETSDLGLYADGSDFGDPDKLRAFVQFGGDFIPGRQSVAQDAGLWTAHSYVPSVPADHSFELCGATAGSPASYIDQPSPTIGLPNSCGVLVQPSSWSLIKSIFR